MDIKWINSNVVFVDQQVPIADAVATMVERQISSVLVANGEGEIVGIVTERDIVRRFTLLPVSDKLNRRVATIMTRPVAFVTLPKLNEQIIKMHTEQRLRHFPVLSGKEPLKSNVIGMVSITDFLKQFIEHLPADTLPQIPRALPLAILARAPQNKEYELLFSELGFTTTLINDFHEFHRSLPPGLLPNVLFDWDGYALEELKDLIVLVKKYRGPVIFATSSPQLVSGFRLHLNKEKHTIAIKPIDLSYCSWLMTHKWPRLPD